MNCEVGAMDRARWKKKRGGRLGGMRAAIARDVLRGERRMVSRMVPVAESRLSPSTAQATFAAAPLTGQGDAKRDHGGLLG